MRADEGDDASVIAVHATEGLPELRGAEVLVRDPPNHRAAGCAGAEREVDAARAERDRRPAHLLNSEVSREHEDVGRRALGEVARDRQQPSLDVVEAFVLVVRALRLQADRPAVAAADGHAGGVPVAAGVERVSKRPRRDRAVVEAWVVQHAEDACADRCIVPALRCRAGVLEPPSPRTPAALRCRITAAAVRRLGRPSIASGRGDVGGACARARARCGAIVLDEEAPARLTRAPGAVLGGAGAAVRLPG